MGIPNEIKKNVANDWCSEFPDLLKYSQNKLYKITGPIVTGIEIIKLPHTDEYRPHFVCYPLWLKEVNQCMDRPLILDEFRNKKGLQFSIPYIKHQIYFTEISECVRAQLILPFDKDISLNILIKMINSYFDDQLIKIHAAKQASLYEFKFYAAMYCCDTAKARSILKDIEDKRKSWNMSTFEMWFGDFKKWIDSLEAVINNRQQLMDQISSNKREKNLQRLHHSELVI